MAIDFKRKDEASNTITSTSTSDNINNVEAYNITEDRNNLVNTYVNSEEVDKIASNIDVYDSNSIVTFGSEVAEEISKTSDVVLNSMDINKINDSGEMLSLLAKIMDRIDIEEIKNDTGFFQKLFGDMKKQLDKILQKYNSIGREIDDIYIKLKEYEAEITKSNEHLEKMFKTNVNYYHELVKYILAGEQGVKEIQDYIAVKTNDMNSTGDQSIQFEITSLEQASMMLEQRTQDLRIAENIAMQSIPMIKNIQFSNMNLIRKINSTFIITLPIFKQGITQALLLKRQKIQADAMSALDAKTNEMLIKNAENTASQSKMIAQMASGSSVKIETLEQTWKTIVSGIEETKQIQENERRKRTEDQIKLNAMKKDFEERYGKNIK